MPFPLLAALAPVAFDFIGGLLAPTPTPPVAVSQPWDDYQREDWEEPDRYDDGSTYEGPTWEPRGYYPSTSYEDSYPGDVEGAGDAWEQPAGTEDVDWAQAYDPGPTEEQRQAQIAVDAAQTQAVATHYQAKAQRDPLFDQAVRIARLGPSWQPDGTYRVDVDNLDAGTARLISEVTDMLAGRTPEGGTAGAIIAQARAEGRL